MKTIKKLLTKNIVIVSLLVLFITPTFVRLLRSGYFSMQDDLQAFRVQQMDRCFDDWQIPCRWVPDAGYQYGYPQFIYYPPSVYYVGAFLHRLGFQYIDTIKVLFVLGYIASAAAMYVLIKSILGRWPGFVAGLLYSYVPYKAVEVYVRGAMSEFWALTFFPLIFWTSYMLIKTSRRKYLIFLAISIFLLLITHVLTTMIFVPFFALWLLFWLRDKWNKKVIFNVISAGLLGLGMAAFYILPLLVERQFAHIESLLSGYFDYRAHFVNLYRLFLSMEWGYGSSGFVMEKLNLSTGIVHWIVGIVAGVLAVIRYQKDKKLARLTLFLVGAEMVVLFMMHLKSSFIWNLVPALAWLQFPWRFLSVSIFLLAILSALAVYFAAKKGIILGVLAVTASILLYAGFFITKDWLNISDAEKFSGASWEKQLTISIFDYLPIYATLPPITKAPPYPEVLEGEVDFVSYQKGSNFQEGEAIVSRAARLRLPLFDFPGMVVYVDGQRIEHLNNDCTDQIFCLGLISFNIDEGEHLIRAQLEKTPARAVGDITSIVSFIAVGVLATKKNVKKSKN